MLIRICPGETGSLEPIREPDHRKPNFADGIVYFYDPEGNDWEFVQYLSQDPAERNDYKLPDR